MPLLLAIASPLWTAYGAPTTTAGGGLYEYETNATTSGPGLQPKIIQNVIQIYNNAYSYLAPPTAAAAVYTGSQQIYNNAYSYLAPPTYQPLAPAIVRRDPVPTAAFNAEAVREREERAAASDRARGLLVQLLDAGQKAEFAAHARVTVRGRGGGLYRIERGRIANIVALDGDGAPTHRLCVHPAGDMPVEDVMLAQLMSLRDDEAALLAAANRRPFLAFQHRREM